MKSLKIFSFVSLLTLGSIIIGCKKDTTSSKTDLTLEMLSDKIWYLNYMQEGSVTKTYISSNTYYIKFLKDNTTQDSDGLVGTYRIDALGSVLQINVTAIFTIEQIYTLKECFNKNTNVIISIFGGRINDLGLNCSDIVKYAVNTFKDYANVKILWAACRTIYNMVEAEQQGAHIVTVPELILSKISSMNKSLEQASIDTVTSFKNDGIVGNINLK